MFLSVLWFCICVILVSERNFVVDVEVGVFVLLWNWLCRRSIFKKCLLSGGVWPELAPKVCV